MSDDVSVRQLLLEQLTPLLPTNWNIKANQVDPGAIDRVTVVFKFVRFTKLPEAPAGSLRNELIVTVVNPMADLVKSENSLDDEVLELVTALDGHKRINWTTAEKVLAYDRYLGWDINVSIITHKKKPGA